MLLPSAVPAARCALALFAALALAACVTWRRAGVDATSAPYLARARQVRVLRTDGAAFLLTRVTVAGDSLAGELLPEGGVVPRRVAVALAQVQRVEVRGVDPARTAGVVLGGAALTVLVALGAIVALYLVDGFQ